MSLRIRLFLGTAVLVLTLTGLQAWLLSRQLDALDLELTRVATQVSDAVLKRVQAIDPPGISSNGEMPSLPPDAQLLTEEIRGASEGESGETLTRKRVSVYATRKLHPEDGEGAGEDSEDGEEARLTVVVNDEAGDRERVLVVKGGKEPETRIALGGSREIVARTLREGLLVSLGLLLLGLFGAAILANRLTAPLEGLRVGAELLGRGDLSTRVSEDRDGELGALQRAFNRMAARLQQLEQEQAAWQARAHLVELGELSRGLAHTLRNPLNTLGLAVEELAGSPSDPESLVQLARSQIRRIDRWLRSFLALGAGGAARPEPLDVSALLEDVVLEAVQSGASIDLTLPAQPLVALGILAACRPALSNLLENAVAALPGQSVEVRGAACVFEGRASVEILISDRGPGLPSSVRERLFAPHVTTRAGGSGMGLFLARQLIEGLQSGRLELLERDGGGTVARLVLPGQEPKVHGTVEEMGH